MSQPVEPSRPAEEPHSGAEGDDREAADAARRKALFDHWQAQGIGSIEGRGGCLVVCEVDPHTGAALLAARDRMAQGNARGEVPPPPSDPLGMAGMVLKVWADREWADGRVGPEHNDAAVLMAKQRWAERPGADVTLP